MTLFEMGTTGLVAWCNQAFGSVFERRRRVVDRILTRRNGRPEQTRIALDKMLKPVEPFADEIRAWKKRLYDSAMINAQVKEDENLAHVWAQHLKAAFLAGKPCPIKPARGYESILEAALHFAQLDRCNFVPEVEATKKDETTSRAGEG